jgi:hypothetical protein
MSHIHPSLYDMLKSSYGNQQSQDTLSKFGLKKDPELSNHNEQVYIDPINHKMVYSVAGTHNLSDIGTDLYLAAGHLKDTNRYKEADKVFKEAKQKYRGYKTTVVGGSLGGTIAGYVAGFNDKVITHNKGATLFQPVRGNETHYKTSGDMVSLLNANSTHTVNLKNNNRSSGNFITDALNAHKVENLKRENIFV